MQASRTSERWWQSALGGPAVSTREREGEREREREKERERERKRKREKEREIKRKRTRETERERAASSREQPRDRPGCPRVDVHHYAHLKHELINALASRVDVHH